MEQPTSTSNTRYSNKAIALCGNISEGYEAVGPFDSWDDAARWTEKWSVESWILTLITPREYVVTRYLVDESVLQE